MQEKRGAAGFLKLPDALGQLACAIPRIIISQLAYEQALKTAHLSRVDEVVAELFSLNDA